MVADGDSSVGTLFVVGLTTLVVANGDSSMGTMFAKWD
jgi:hypothetical protein